MYSYIYIHVFICCFSNYIYALIYSIKIINKFFKLLLKAIQNPKINVTGTGIMLTYACHYGKEFKSLIIVGYILFFFFNRK